MSSEIGASRSETARATIIPSCTERDFFETIYPYDRHGVWNCIYCGEPIEYASDGTVYIGSQRLSCRVEDLGHYYQLCPQNAASATVNRCCSDRISAADHVIPLGRTITCPICSITYVSAMVTRWQGSSRVKGYLRDDGSAETSYAVDHNLAVPSLMPVERLSSRPR